MMLVGGFIDLFPVAAGAYGVWILFTTESDILSIGIMVIMTVLMLVAAGYFERYIRVNYCMKCINFSCTMNKIPKDVVGEYLLKNPVMKDAWVEAGYQLDNE